MKRARARIVGHVQGVFFRAELRDRARARDVAGWARNAGDGSLDALLEGEDAAVEALLDWCRRGPAGARVDHVEVEWEEPRGEQGFAVG